MTANFYINQRLSYDGALCTVRYIGQVEFTKGEWLGVEWDDILRGKHSGSYKEIEYFQCKIPGSGSFIRPTRNVDPSVSFLGGLRKKYTTAEDPPGRRHEKISLTTNKVVEEVGFDKIIQKLSQLRELKIVLLDGLCINRVDDIEDILETCPSIEELDLSRNRFENLEDIEKICSALPNLKALRISGNRFRYLAVSTGLAFSKITSLEIANVLLDWAEIGTILSNFPNLLSILAPHNNFSSIPSPAPLPPSVHDLDLSHNIITSLASLTPLSRLPSLKTLILAHNFISDISCNDNTVFTALKRLDIGYNAVPSFQQLDHLASAAPNLDNLRISHNPFYNGVTIDDGLMLTIGRLPVTVRHLNHSEITPKERENAELWYLSKIGKELAASGDKLAVLATHRRWGELCGLHGEPMIGGESGIDADRGNSMFERLVQVEFVRKETVLIKRIPKSTPVSTLRGLVARWFETRPLDLKLVCKQVGKDEDVVLEDADDTRDLSIHLEAGRVRIVIDQVIEENGE